MKPRYLMKLVLLTNLLVLSFVPSSFGISFGLQQNIIPLDSEKQWHLIQIGAEEAWNITQGRKEVIVAVIDSGVSFQHPALQGQFWKNKKEIANNNIDDDRNGYIDDVYGWDFRDNDSDPSPGHWHGTFVAGMIAAANIKGNQVGIAPNISIMNIRFLDNKNAYYGNDYDKFAKAIDYAVDNGADIIQISIYDNGIPPDILHDAIKRAYNQGVVIVGITGNNGNDVTYPGKYPEVIAVSATDNDLNPADFSGKGPENEISAPGEDLYGIVPFTNESLDGFWGTSFASPLVAGTIALMLSINNSLTIPEIRTILHKSSIDLGSQGKDDEYGYGFLSAARAVYAVAYGIEQLPPITSSSTNQSHSTTITSQTVNGFQFTEFAILTAVMILTLFIRKRKKDK